MEFKRQPKKTHTPPNPATKNHPSPTVSHVLSSRSHQTNPPARSLKTKPPRAHRPSKKGIVLICCLLASGVMLFSFFYTTHNAPEENPQNSSKQSAEQLGLTSSSPPFEPALPQGKSIESLGGWQRVSPSKNDPTYAYFDKIGTSTITVSQQSLPKSFENNTDSQVAELAKKFSATTELKVNSTKVYIGTSAKGPQSVIFSTKSLLILIKSQQTINDTAWTSYIRSLL